MKKNSILLITGGTGSFGQAVLNKNLDNKNIKEIRILSRDEEKQDKLRRKLKNKKIKFYIGDVRDYKSIEPAIIGSDYIFHAAALKQVPSCEFFPLEAVKTNILGTENVLDASIKHKVKKVIVLSTDKAVYPVNAMGMSKALMEKVMIAKSRIGGKKTLICGTRYGNVMASRGSVIPIMINQIKMKKDLTVTDGSMTRFMMSLENAVTLVDYAYKNANPGDLFVMKAPSTNMLLLAQTLKEIFNSKSKIKFIGVRHGEKNFETLVNREEKTYAEENKNYFRILPDKRSLNYESYHSLGEERIIKFKEYTSENTTQLKKNELKKILLKLDEVKKEIEN
jgi:UDP-N-acetylglucosamine 4,6-dehydratase/5-epimerase